MISDVKNGVLAGLVLCLATLSTAFATTNTCLIQLDMSVQTALGNFNAARNDKVAVSGSWNNWTTTNYLAAGAGNTNLYTITCLITNGAWPVYKFVINSNNTGVTLWERPDSQAAYCWGNRSFGMPGSGGTNLPVVFFSDQTNAACGFPFLVAADFSHLKFFEDRGISYKSNGVAQDVLALIKSKGVAAVRLRLFTGTDAQVKTNTAYDYTNNLSYNLPLAARVKKAGLKFILDFHYSDTWADANDQLLPKTWTNGLTYASLLVKMRTYNSNCIAAFIATNAMPDFVQVGNEITCGMLYSYGKVGGQTNWNQLAALINAAVQGIRDAAGTNMPQIILHIDRGGDLTSTLWFFDAMTTNSVTYDIIGESYYPFWHGSWSNNVASCVTNAVRRYDKPVMLMETAFPWNTTCWTTNIYGIAPSTNGQVMFITGLAKVMTNVPARFGAGIAWWGAEYQAVSGVNEAGFYTASFFDSGGNILPVAGVFGKMNPAPVFTNLTASLSSLSGATNISMGGNLRVFWATNVATAPDYPASGEAVFVTINGNTQTGAFTNSTGGFFVSFDPSAIAPSTNRYTITYSYAGSASLYPASDTNTTLTVTNGLATLTVALTGTVAKTYDGTTAATLTPDNYLLSGLSGGDSVALNNPSGGTYDFRNAGAGKTVTVTGLAISGTDSGKYTLAGNSISGAVGTITAAALTVTGVTAADKVYDGTTRAMLNVGGAKLEGVVGGDGVTLVTSHATAFFF
jgi:arabinogalactan endo-1,4-beta-galactosidase